MVANSKPVQRGYRVKPTKQADASSVADRKRRQSDLLDEGLKETFPASDPVSVVLVE